MPLTGGARCNLTHTWVCPTSMTKRQHKPLLLIVGRWLTEYTDIIHVAYHIVVIRYKYLVICHSAVNFSLQHLVILFSSRLLLVINRYELTILDGTYQTNSINCSFLRMFCNNASQQMTFKFKGVIPWLSCGLIM